VPAFCCGRSTRSRQPRRIPVRNLAVGAKVPGLVVVDEQSVTRDSVDDRRTAAR
jgi:hypothetical protein